MEVPVVVLTARMTCSAVGGRRSHPLVSFSALRWAATTEMSASEVCNWVAMSFSTPMRPMWSCGAGLGGVGRLTSVQRQNQTRARLSAQRKSGSAMTHGDLTATAWRKATTSSQFSMMVVNVLAVACFASPGFVVFSSYASMVTSLSSSFFSSTLLTFSPSFAHSVIEQAEIFRRSPASDSPQRVAASIRNDGRRTALCGVQSRCFFERARSPAAAQRRTSGIGRQILSPSAAKAMSILTEITEGELRYTSREKTTTDSPSDFFQMDAWPDVNCNLAGVAILVSIARLGESLQTFLYFLAAASIARMNY